MKSIINITPFEIFLVYVSQGCPDGQGTVEAIVKEESTCRISCKKF
jgi:hypothetical protein